MEHGNRTLVVFLSMHRCGSSLATQILHRMGMSLGPFPLMGAAPSNPHGHFEAMPFYELNRRVQELTLGFADDLPDSTAVLSGLIKRQGEWPDGARVPDELFDRGHALIRDLIESGEVSGFKDPRTVLTWPFWQRVLRDFRGLKVVPVSLLRSPHEIAMSLVTRRHGWVSYWSALDVVAVHLRRQQAILHSMNAPARGVCFGSPSFMEALVEVARQCGLAWNADKAREVFDPSCVHQVPAVVPHEAQGLFNALLDEPATGPEDDKNRAQFVKDVRAVESLRLEEWRTVGRRVVELQEQAEVAQFSAGTLATQLQETRAKLDECRLQLIDAQRQVIENQQARNAIQQHLSESLARELLAWQRNDALRARLDRYQSHPILGPAIRGGRHLRTIVHSIRPAPTTAATRNGRTEPA